MLASQRWYFRGVEPHCFVIRYFQRPGPEEVGQSVLGYYRLDKEIIEVESGRYVRKEDLKGGFSLFDTPLLKDGKLQTNGELPPKKETFFYGYSDFGEATEFLHSLQIDFDQSKFTGWS